MILRGSVFSEILQMDTGITIITPNKIKTNSNYQVVYLLHGLCGNNGSWADNTMLPVYSDDYNVIFIMPEVARSLYTDMKYGLNFFTYITEELPNICKSIFNISSKREDTAVIGGSMGGYGALKCAFSKPEQYGYCCALSSAYLFLREYLNTQRSQEKIKKFKNNYEKQLIKDFEAAFGKNLDWSPKDEPLELAKRISKQSIKPKIYSACGLEDPFRESNIKFCYEMQNLDLNFTYEEWTGIHNWHFFNEALRKSLEFCFGV